VCRVSLAIVDGDEESEQDISEQCGGNTRGKLCGIGGDAQDGALVRLQGVASHRGRQRGERTNSHISEQCGGPHGASRVVSRGGE
jgi:hypothetical protein